MTVTAKIGVTKHELVHICTLNIVPLLDRRQHFELLQDVDSVVQHIEHYWDEDAKADPPCGARCSTGVRSVSMAAAMKNSHISILQEWFTLPAVNILIWQCW